MTRFYFIVLFFLLFAPVAFATQSSDDPPSPEIASLAEQLAPLIKANPVLPTLKKSDDKTTPKNNDTTKSVTEESSDEPADLPNPVEDGFSQRASQELKLFGYNQIGQHLSEAPTTGQVQDDVILGSGDRVMVTFRGQRDDSKTYTISPQGELIVKGLDPITASGLTVGALRELLERETSRNLLNSTVFVSVKSLRQLAIMVMGEVKQPGVFTLNPFQTVLDAITMAKGITKNGSLREVKLLRAGKTINLDFYQLLLKGDLGTPIQLRDGDKIMVPVLGETIAVAGDVKRSGIFERPHDATLSFDDILQLCGGPTRPVANQFVKLSLNAWGDEKVTDIYPGDKVNFQDGDILMVTGGTPLRTNGIQIAGQVRQPGPRPLNKIPDLKSLLNNPRVLREGVYPLIGVIERLDPKTLNPSLIAFSPSGVLQGQDNEKLHERDRVLFFSTEELRPLLNKKSDQELAEEKQQSDKLVVAGDPDALKKEKPITTPNPLLTPEIIDFLSDRTVSVKGAVLLPGLYPVAGKPSLNEIIDVAGGLKPDAEKAHVDIILSNATRDGQRYTIDMNTDRPNKILISAQDKININAEYTSAEKRGVEIMGEVARPGKYDLRKGDTLLDIIKRAGGETDLAYSGGTIFMRESERLKQEEQFKNAARSLDLAVAGYYLKKDGAADNAEQIKNAENISTELRNVKALGRITVEADPATLEENPDRAILLQQGDRIYVPRRSPIVTVAGEVQAPSVQQYLPDKTGKDYIALAGGTTKLADESRKFIVFPDGSASPLSGVSSNWGGSSGIPEGSIIFVPRDPDPLDFLKVTETVGNILSQLAITALTAAELQRPYY
jgi:polysaccharide export outer membrane protein